ncbi:MAG: TFIIB-type zinc finger domain-containing protein [Pseudomonadota bacterium]
MCPNCESKNVKRSNEGFILDAYICQECHTVFERLTPTAETMANSIGRNIVTGTAGVTYIIHS